ncbi:MAG: ArsR family transcriptional regulator [Saprospiraceae bacterium]|nr:ArsR family transcriptional regulator [Saprospiraceae bacterium]
MTPEDAKEKFIKAWGNFGINWGVNRTVGQIHGLLLVSDKPLCADQIAERLKISSGNTNMTLRTLIDWGLIQKDTIQGERKEYFIAEKDSWKILQRIIKQRKKKELDPMLELLSELDSADFSDDSSKEFGKMVKDLHTISERAGTALDNITKSEPNWLLGSFMRMIR